MIDFWGLDVRRDDSLYQKKWKFPKSRFYEWEEKDEYSCRVLGIGEEVDVPYALVVEDKTLYAPQQIIDALLSTNRVATANPKSPTCTTLESPKYNCPDNWEVKRSLWPDFMKMDIVDDKRIFPWVGVVY